MKSKKKKKTGQKSFYSDFLKWKVLSDVDKLVDIKINLCLRQTEFKVDFSVTQEH